MGDWHDSRRLDGAIHEQIRINEEIAQRSKPNTIPGETKWAVLFILAVLFVKPIAEYAIEVYTAVSRYAQEIAALGGF